MGWRPGQDDETGDAPGRGPGLPSGRDQRLAGFAAQDGTDALLPSGELALLADEVSGPERRCAGATDNELIGLTRAWAALESWAAAAKLGAIRELIRRDGVPAPGSDHGDLPETWSPSVRYELAQALACSTQSAETTAWLAWELQARLPGIAALLDDGTLTFAKARAVAETFKYLTDPDAAAAEALIAGLLAGKTYTQVLRLAEQAALTIDPDLAARRREQAQKRSARVTCFREPAGTAALSGRDLPPDEALAAMASVNDRAGEYRESDAFGDTPMDVLRAQAYLDLLNGVPGADRIARAEPQDDHADNAESLAWAKSRADRAARQAAAGAAGAAAASPDRADDRQCDNARPASEDCACAECDGGCLPDDDFAGDEPEDSDSDDGDPDVDASRDDPSPDDPSPDDGAPDDGSPDDGPGPGGGPPGPAVPPAGTALQRRPADLIVPLGTLLGLAERPGEIQGFGLLDPALARELAAAAAASPPTEVCVTVTSPEGYAIGHGCARPDRPSRPPKPPASPAGSALPGTALPGSALPGTASPGTASPGTAPPGLRDAALARLPARLNLTVAAAALPAFAQPALAQPALAGPWAFTSNGSSGPPRTAASPGTAAPPRTAAPPATAAPPGGGALRDGYGSWTLVLPGDRRFTVRLDLVPTFDCDHRYESGGYRPSDRLRHLVQIRDGTCTFPSCNRHAREADFEHAHPYDKGGRTCACNAGARSRACHRVKQSPGWNVTQPKPGWHRWQTPAGRVYTQEPKRYPA